MSRSHQTAASFEAQACSSNGVPQWLRYYISTGTQQHAIDRLPAFFQGLSQWSCTGIRARSTLRRADRMIYCTLVGVDCCSVSARIISFGLANHGAISAARNLHNTPRWSHKSRYNFKQSTFCRNAVIAFALGSDSAADNLTIRRDGTLCLCQVVI